MMIDASTPPVSAKPGRSSAPGQGGASPFAAKLADAGPADAASARAHEVAGPGTTGSRAPDESPTADASAQAGRQRGHTAAARPSTEPAHSEPAVAAENADAAAVPPSDDAVPPAADLAPTRDIDPASEPPTSALAERPVDRVPAAHVEAGGTTPIPTPTVTTAVDTPPTLNPLAANVAATDTDAPLPTDDALAVADAKVCAPAAARAEAGVMPSIPTPTAVAATNTPPISNPLAATDTDAPLPTDDALAVADAKVRAPAAAVLESGLRRAEQMAALQEAVQPAAELGGAERAAAGAPGLAVSHAATALAPAALTVAPAVPLDSGRLLMSEAAPQLAERIRSMVDEQVSEIKLRLDPPKLGSVDVQLAIRDNQVAVSLASSDPQARLLLAQALPDLAASLASRGLQLMGADVGHPSQEHDRQPAERLVRQAAEDADAAAPAVDGRAVPRGLLDHYA
jgi:flagellar hook-length control protein FliK